jgi:hypothetical protein
MKLKIDSSRWTEKEKWEGTGIYVRAKSPLPSGEKHYEQ